MTVPENMSSYNLGKQFIFTRPVEVPVTIGVSADAVTKRVLRPRLPPQPILQQKRNIFGTGKLAFLAYDVFEAFGSMKK